ncbi:MAG: hypothetical protein R2848_01145 [Thermomicrobiales bacterium]
METTISPEFSCVQVIGHLIEPLPQPTIIIDSGASTVPPMSGL